MSAKTISILGRLYQIKNIKGLSETKGLDGFCDHENAILAIDSRLKGEYRLRIFFHELAHAIDHETGLYEILDDQSLELHAQAMSGILSNLFKLK